MTIHPVILAGGTGTRLWPLSRAEKPKQFVTLNEKGSLFQSTLRRLAGQGFADPVVLTTKDFEYMVADQAAAADTKLGRVIVEPEGRNTAPSIFTAALSLDAGPDDLMLVLPSDHQVSDPRALMRAVKAASKAAKSGKLVTFGVRPDRAATGYGYLEIDGDIDQAAEVMDLKAFVEKPDVKTAEAYVAGGKHLWNSGLFLFRVSDIISAFEVLAPTLILPCQGAIRRATFVDNKVHLDADSFLRAPAVSIDHAIMELSEALAVVPVDCGWTDYGSWRAIWQAEDSDDKGNVLTGPAMAIDCQNSLLRSEREGIQLVGMGLDNIAAIATGDAVLVINLNDAQAVKEAVDLLKKNNAAQATDAQERQRPWGFYETLALGDRFQVKRIVVKPGGQLSLQSHVHRSEHWVVVSGTAQVTVGEEVKLLSENKSTYIPVGEVHRLENPGKVPLTLIEVQSGAYLGEDDIIRYEDIYDRAPAVNLG